MSNGTEVYRKTDVNIEKAVTTFARLKLETGWYKVTRQKWERSYPSDGTQQNPTIGKFSDDQNNGPEVGNLPIYFEVTADANTSDLVLEAGSVSQINLGQVTSQRRVKSFNFEHTFSTTGSWVPILAIRVDPDRSIVNTQLQRLIVASWSGNDDVEILVQAHDPSKVLESDDTELDDADYSVPNVVSDQNNVIETSTAVTQAPDNTGTPTTSTANPGGVQVGLASSRAQQQGTSRATTATEVKRPIYGRDVAVVWGLADSSNTVVVDLSIEQDW